MIWLLSAGNVQVESHVFPIVLWHRSAASGVQLRFIVFRTKLSEIQDEFEGIVTDLKVVDISSLQRCLFMDHEHPDGQDPTPPVHPPNQL